MGSKFFLCLGFILMLSCQNSELIETQNKPCDCKALLLDQRYNRFYLTDKKEPFTGKCESFYPNEKLEMERNYVDGKYHGDVIDYYDNGQIKSISQYKNHFINGYVKTYSYSGKLIKHTIYKQSTEQEIVEYHPEINLTD